MACTGRKVGQLPETRPPRKKKVVTGSRQGRENGIWLQELIEFPLVRRRKSLTAGGVKTGAPFWAQGKKKRKRETGFVGN